MNLEDLNVFKLSMEISEVIWNEIFKWNYFQKNTVGSQLIRAVDSISANIAEGFGRYSFKENKQFCYYSRGS
jgi:four helix bundle protein